MSHVAKNMLAATLFAASLGLSAPAESAMIKTYSSAEREVIRQMPITMRPYRPGHIYGNTVRMLNRYGLWYGQK